ncbi:hypothetical protein TUMSATVNIG1_59790 (plasmid) [Vibrio nigripulchritudo]|uniref:hypothetical protein n=1 Tax=Vibrio nigripulchritudo TaxID=28173 RepID=UPI00190DCE3E|nr:hypothetical protein [Vibrio nigripulchritudo]BCL73993.1 hypothetical protein VNTUMSATTG_59300 [Vibrio nigripulchritudo]BDU35370.1 hypothetical protein TUMSATVNIG1_59790 [Vibrio nigripulchritudo]
MKLNQTDIFLKQVKEAAQNQREELLNRIKLNQKKMHSAFFRKFDPLGYSQNLKAMILPFTSEYTSHPETIPVKAGIPLTDLILYGLKRYAESSSQDVRELKHQLINDSLKLMQIPEFLVMPSLTAATNSPVDGEGLYVPTYGEVLVSTIVSDLPSCTEEFYSSTIPYMVSQLNKVDPAYGSQSFPVALLALQSSNYTPEMLTDFDKSTVDLAVRFTLENDIQRLSDKPILNLLKAASERDIPLSELKLKGTLSLDLYFANIDESLHEYFTALSTRQVLNAEVHSDPEKYDYSYNPNQYFDY